MNVKTTARPRRRPNACSHQHSRRKPGEVGRVLAAIPPAHDVRGLVRARIDKRGRHLGPFENRRKALAEKRKRSAMLRAQTGRPSAALARTLERCRWKHACGSMACPRCARLRRIAHSASILAFLANYPVEDLRFVTLINSSDAIPAGQLHLFEPRKLINRLRRQLDRLGIDKSQCFLVGGVDGEWDEGWAVYQPHFHLITWGIAKAHLSALVKKWVRKDPHARKGLPKRVRVRKRDEPIDDLPRVVAYIEKSFWPSVARANNPAGVHPHGKRPLPAPIEVEVLLWLLRQTPSDMRLFYAVRRHRKGIMGI